MIHSVVGVGPVLGLDQLARDALYFHCLEADLLVAAEHLLRKDGWVLRNLVAAEVLLHVPSGAVLRKLLGKLGETPF